MVEQLELERKQTRTLDKKRRKLNQDPIQTNLITKFTKTLKSKEEHLEPTNLWISATLDPEILVEQTVLTDRVRRHIRRWPSYTNIPTKNGTAKTRTKDAQGDCAWARDGL